MKVLFVQDAYFFTSNEKQYYSEHIDNTILKRYLHLGEFVTFLGRIDTTISNEELIERFSLLDNSKSTIIGLPNFKTPLGFIKYIRYVKKQVEKAVLEHDIIMPRIPSALGALAVKYAIKHNKPLLGEVVGCTWDGYWNYSIKGKIVAPYYFFKQKNIVKKLPYAVYVTSEFLQRRYPTYGKNTNCSNVVIKNIDYEILKNRLDKIKKLKKNDIIKIGTIGGLDVPFKGQKYVIQSLPKLNTDKYTYAVVGTGTGELLKREAERLNIEDIVHVNGPMKHNEVFNFLDEIDLYIQPSKQEGLPRALIEAMSRGLPAIGSRTGGIPELLREEFIFDKGDTKQLSEIINTYDLSKFPIEAEENFNKAKEYFIDTISNRRLNFYIQFLKDHNLPINELLKETGLILLNKN